MMNGTDDSAVCCTKVYIIYIAICPVMGTSGCTEQNRYARERDKQEYLELRSGTEIH